jgi:hypothetical protein
MPAKLTERDLEVLEYLHCACNDLKKSRGDGSEWVTPMYCGGHDGSDHSYRLTKLAKYGYAEEKPRSRSSRGSKLYRITDLGRETLEKGKS